MKIFATGTTGLIGSSLNDIFPLKIDLLDAKTFGNFQYANVTVIHLAGIVGEALVRSDYEKAFEVNVRGTLEFARHVLKDENSRFLYISSSHVYQNTRSRHKELDTLKPINLYGKMKLEAELGLQQIFKNEPQRLCIARVFSVLDVGMPKGTLGWAIENLNQNSPLRNCDDVRDFLTPSEIANHLLKIAKKEFKFPVVNVCSGKGRYIRDACVELRHLKGLITPEELLIGGNSEVPYIVGDNSRLLCL